tara:strand:- start:53 stop:538 length:486 start_codon:yes stop_codon:yes gene_type:complete
MNTSHTEYLNYNFEKKINSITDNHEKYTYLKKNFIHVLSEVTNYFQNKKDRIHRELPDIKKKLENAILKKNIDNINEYSSLFLLGHNELQVIDNYYKNNENLKRIFNNNVYNNILYKKTAVPSSNIIEKLNQFTPWVNKVNNNELTTSWTNIVNECTKSMN